MGRWAAARGVPSVVVSHERLDRLLHQLLLPAPAARRVADWATRRMTASYDTVVCTTGFAREEFDRIGARNVVQVPLGVDLALHESGQRVRLVIAGDGPCRAALQRRAAGRPVTFLGFVPGRGEVARLLATSDVSLAPGPHETFGLAALEPL